METGSPWLFANPRSRVGGPWEGRLSPGVVRGIVVRAGDAAQILGRHHPHRWRHSFATEVLTAAVDVHTTQRLLGHVKAGTTAGYLHLLDDESVRRGRPGVRCVTGPDGIGVAEIIDALPDIEAEDVSSAVLRRAGTART